MVGGVVMATTDWLNVTMNPVTFVQQMYANGAKGYFDALSIHPYSYTDKFSAGGPDSPLEQLIAIRQLMIEKGDTALKIWATEYGLPTFGLNAFTEEEQADYIEDFLTTWKALGDYLGPAFIYTMRDRLTKPNETDPQSGEAESGEAGEAA